MSIVYIACVGVVIYWGGRGISGTCETTLRDPFLLVAVNSLSISMLELIDRTSTLRNQFVNCLSLSLSVFELSF